MNEPRPLDHDAFLRHYVAHEPAIRIFVRMLVPSQSDADDVMQEVAIVLWRKFAEYDERRDFRGWAFGVAKMKVLAWQRDRSRERHVFMEDLTETLAREAESGAERLAAQREALLACIEQLPQDQKRFLDIAYAGKRRIHTIASVLGQSIEATYKRLHRLRLVLINCTRARLDQEGWNP
jgi:RNA polymerase sigma-70 factor (ECF subfamily)